METAGPARVLVLGGQRSGKSRYAERLVAASGRRLVHLATATAGDDEMAERIARHQARRGAEKWRTVEEPVDLAGALLREARTDAAVLVDCLTLWLTNLMVAERPIEPETDRLLAALAAVAGPVAIVSNEVGSGIIPANALARRYADALGTLNQRVAEAVDRVVLMVAGMPLFLKPAQKQNEVVL
jgi:adenosylcobinamide kinase/adenosylcobinamide-phosphate guanylyltransferase